MIGVLLSTLAVAAVLLLARFLPGSGPAPRWERAEAWLRRFGPWAAAVVSIAVIWFVWDQVVPIAKVQDESSYLLQADIFARGRWTVPSPPIPDFFEQPHVQVVPAVASKYPPGHALLLTLGALVGFHALVPLLLTGITGALVFALAGRITNPWIGLVTWFVWLTAPIVLKFQPSYFSELTTTPLVLASWWLLLDWRATHARRWLVLMALAIGWGAITRPLTMLAFAIPIGVVVLRDTVRHRLWKDFGLAFATGVVILLVLPLWNAKTTGDWRLSAVEQYRRDYLPFDKIGFSFDSTPPRRSVSPVLSTTYDYFRLARTQQTARALPEIIGTRAVNLATGFFQGTRLALVPFALVGLFVMPAAVGFALASAAVLFVVHLPYAHWAPWTLYYLETTPVVALLIAIGAWHVLRRAVRDARNVPPGMVALLLVLAGFAAPAIQRWRMDHRARSRFDRSFAAALKTLPAPAVVFITYSPRFSNHVNVVFNHADLERAPYWVVHDLGPRNEELRRLAPGRASFDFDEEQLRSAR